MKSIGESDVEELLDAWPQLRRRPVGRSGVCTLVGQFGFELAPHGKPVITDWYTLRIEIPLGKADALLGVFEEGGRLRKDPDEHINSDGSLCLGSPLRLRLLMRESNGLVSFLERCLVPFLYAATWRSQGNVGYPFQELPHYGPGLIEDYGSLIGIHGQRPISIALKLLSTRRRVANKRQCACGSRKRLGACQCRYRLNGLRNLAPRSFWKKTLSEYLSQCPLPEVPARPKRTKERRQRRHLIVTSLSTT